MMFLSILEFSTSSTRGCMQSPMSSTTAAVKTTTHESHRQKLDRPREESPGHFAVNQSH